MTVRKVRTGASSAASIPWWEWERERKTLRDWVRPVIGALPCSISYCVGRGSYMRFDPLEVVIDPTLVNQVGGEQLLPFTWRGTRLTTLAKLQKVVSRKGARHEGGHAIISSACKVIGQLHGWLTNALEDERMEQLEGRVRRASRADFLAYARMQALHVLPHYGWTPATHSRADALLNACLFWRWCSKFPGSFARFPFPCEDDLRFWEEEIRPLVEASWGVETTQDAADIALDILGRIGIPERETTVGHVLVPLGLVEFAAADPVGYRPLSPSDLPPENEPGSRGGDEEEGGGLDGPEGDEEPTQIDVDDAGGILWARPYRGLVQQVNTQARRTREKLRAPTPDIEVRFVSSGGRPNARAAIRTHGLRPNVLRREMADTTRALRVILLLDHTTSMNGYWPLVIDPLTGEPDAEFFNPEYRMVHARRLAMTFELACMGAGIPLCIGAAGTGLRVVHYPHALNVITRVSQKETILWLRDWWIPPQAEGPKALISGLYGKGGNEQLIAALGQAFRKFRELPPDGAINLLLYVHDGQPDEETEDIRAALARVRKAGVMVFGIFVGPQELLYRVEEIFGRQWTVGVPDPELLPERVSRIVTRLRRCR